MPELRIFDVSEADLPLLHSALRQLSLDLEDPYRIDRDTLKASLFGLHPSCHAALATGQDDALLGAVLFSPVVSTAAGGVGVYVSDLWVAEAVRGQALGRKLLAHVAGRAGDLWQARFIRLVSYAANQRARTFYSRLGFVEKPDELVLQLTDDAFDQLNR